MGVLVHRLISWAYGPTLVATLEVAALCFLGMGASQGLPLEAKLELAIKGEARDYV